MATKNSGGEKRNRKWNVMVYLAGDNNLSEEMVYALKEIRRIGTTDEFKQRAQVIAQFDPRGAKPERFDFNKPGPVRVQAQMQGEAGTLVAKYRSSGAGIAPTVTATKKGTEEMRAALADEAGNYPARAGGPLEGITKYSPARIGSKPPEEPPDVDGDLKDFIDESFTAENVLKRIKKLPIYRGIRISDVKEIEAFKKNILENSADPKVVAEFISSNIKDSKTAHNLLVLSGHGNGAVGDFLPDEEEQTHLSIPMLRKVLEEVATEEKKIDILGFDSCLMSMAEVCYEIRNKVEYVIGAEGFLLNTGWPFHRVLEAVKDDGKKGPEKLARTLVKRYSDYYGDYELVNVSTDLSALDLKKIDSLAAAVGRMTAIFNPILKKEIDRKKEEEERSDKEGRGTGKVTKPEETLEAILDVILRAHWDAQSYKSEQYVDLYDFSERLKKACDARTGGEKGAVAQVLKNVSDACGEVKNAVERVVLKSCYVGPDFQHSHGLSVYFPWSPSKNELAEYGNLKFSQETKWGEFVVNYLETTRRERRQIPGIVRDVPREDDSASTGISKFVTEINKATPDEGMFTGGKVAKIKNSPDKYTVEKCE